DRSPRRGPSSRRSPPAARRLARSRGRVCRSPRSLAFFPCPGRAQAPCHAGGTALAAPSRMKDQKPRNKDGEAPTASATETEVRLEEKEHEDRGQANKDRIEAQISSLKA